jgi:hypothetical protein
MKREYNKILFLIVSCFIFDAHQASAQQKPTAPAVNIADGFSVEFDEITDPKIQNPTQMFDGWSSLFQSNKSPILFDKADARNSVKYPGLGFNTDQQAKSEERDRSQQKTLKTLNLGVDDEVSRMTMLQYQPIEKIQQEFANSEAQTDKHLDLFATQRGITLLTLQYLDKTVASGLATIQSQADANNQQMLLKQINYASQRLSKPSRELLYQDTDDKVEACLASISPQNISADNPRIRFDTGICAQQCLGKNKTDASIPLLGAGRLQYCVCCSELQQKTNYATDMSRTADLVGGAPYYSVVEKVFFGSELGTTVSGRLSQSNILTANGQRTMVKAAMQTFREMYGDIILTDCNSFPTKERGNGEEDSKQCKGQKIEYRFPNYTIADKIRLFRDGAAEGCDTNQACPLTATIIKEGICPAIRKINDNWTQYKNPAGGNKDELSRLWVQASLGHMLTAQFFENLEKTSNFIPTSLNQNQSSLDPRGEKWLAGFCDSSSYAAFVKFHTRLESIVQDHFALNRKATEQEKRMVMELMGRVSRQIQLAEQDYNANWVAGKMESGMNMEAGQIRESELGATRGAIQGRQGNMAQSSDSSMSGFTGTGQVQAE